MTEFKRQVVAEKYRALVDIDPIIHVGCFSGRLSEINECGAAALIRSKSPYIELIPGADTED